MSLIETNNTDNINKGDTTLTTSVEKRFTLHDTTLCVHKK